MKNTCVYLDLILKVSQENGTMNSRPEATVTRETEISKLIQEFSNRPNIHRNIPEIICQHATNIANIPSVKSKDVPVPSSDSEDSEEEE